MSDVPIPEDIRERAQLLAEGFADDFPAAIEAIARALMAEIERCALIAEAPDRRGREWVPGSLWDTLRSETGAAIRRGTP